MSRIAIIGNLTVDLVGNQPPRVGGAVFYGARAAARLGADAGVVARCAEHDRELCLTPLEAFGLPVAWRPGRTTSRFAFHYEGERRVMAVEAVGDPWLPEDITGWASAHLADAAWVHAGALLRSDFSAATFAALAAGGRRVLVDAQGLVRRAEVGPLVRDAEVDLSLLEHVTVLKLNESEANVIAGGVDAEAMRALGVAEIVLTLGSTGSLVVAGGQARRIPAAPVRTTDPTGAGDSFSLAYLAARSAGAMPVAAAEHASAFVSELLAPS